MAMATIVFGLALAFVIGCNVYLGPRITADRIAMQWGLDGKPTWSAPKQLAIWGLAAFMLVVGLAILAAAIYAPDQVNRPELGLVLFSITVAGVHLILLRAAMRRDD